METVPVFVIVILVIICWYIYEFNIIKTLHNKVLQSRSSIDVALNKRFDLIPNLVECVKGYVKYEEKIFETVTKQRTEFYRTNNLQTGSDLSNKCNQILGISERYPELKANEQFLDLQNSLSQTENQLQAARRLYNSDVTMFNTKITTFPGNMVASVMKQSEEPLFEIEDYKRENINLKNM